MQQKKLQENQVFSQVLRSPADFLKHVIGKNVCVKLNSGDEYFGRLICVDGYMNIAMENTQGRKPDASGTNYPEAFIRGSTGKGINDAI